MTSQITFPVNTLVGNLTIELPQYIEVVALPDRQICEAFKSFAKFTCEGEKNSLYRGQNTQTSKLTVKIKGKRNKIIIGSNADVRGTINIVGGNLTVLIGASTTFNNVNIYCKGWNHSVFIGKDCMFSSDIEIRTSDSHSVIDLERMETTNPPDGVFIGDHVWISKFAFIQRGSVLASDTIVGFGTMINGNFSTENKLIVGRPGREVPNRRVSWARKGELKVVDDSIYQWRELPLL
ncbi:Acetyltransferase (isoleucine patch superfamily) [Rhizobium sp. NFR07]|uniref:acyltransferase n=1 Tax=Rhizobium sp. NFR07 TaxID=1566262 RepID=UPI0008E8A207|nr:hypothetical protein [Rhizobium sp. NFR07]SFB59624.1 Acetyltransferase (isoleucine patch superfamily) [Rhizobium sp. NFR07]